MGVDGFGMKKRDGEAQTSPTLPRASGARSFAAMIAGCWPAFVAALAIALVITTAPALARVFSAFPGGATAAAAAGIEVDREAAFFAPRAYPANFIPGGAREQAVRQMQAMAEASSGAQPAWHPIVLPAGALANSGAASSTVNAIAIDPSDPTGKTKYIGAAGGGVWKTTDGANWSPLTDNQPSLAISSLALDAATSPATIYAGTGARTQSGESFYGAGVMKSADGGKIWAASGSAAFSKAGEGGVSIEALAVNPNPGAHRIILAGVSGSGSGASGIASSVANNGGGVWRSVDGGATWALALGAPAGGAGFDVKFDANDPSGHTAYAALGRSSGSSTAVASCDTAMGCNGIYMSSDAGANWTRLVSLDSVADPTRAGRMTLGLGAQPGAKTSLYLAIADADSSSANLFGIFKSADGGATWTAIANPPNGLCASACFQSMTLAVSPVDPAVVFAGGEGLYRSIDGGNSWQDVTKGRSGVAIHAGQRALSLGRDGSTVYVGNDGGVWRSPDVADAGVAAVAHAWIDLNGGSRGGAGLNILRLDSDAGLKPTATIAGANSESGGIGLPYRVQTSFAVDPVDSRISYAAFSGFSGINGSSLGHVFTSASAGAQWRDISGNLPNIPVNAIIVDPGIADTFYVATDIGVFATNNQGATWTPLGAGLPIVPVTSLTLQKSSRVLTAETYGRGAWSLSLSATANPVPTVTSITPTSIDVGNGTFVLTVTGTNFVTGSVINIGNSSLTPIGAQSATLLAAQVPTGVIATAAVFNVSVTNPTPGGGTSNAVEFDVQDYAYGAITPSPTVTVTAGFTAQFVIPVIALNGFNVPLTLTCSGAPGNSACSFSPTSVTPTATGATETMLVATIANNSLAPARGSSGRLPPSYRKIWLPIGGAIAMLLAMAWLAMRAGSRAWRRRFALGASLAGIVLAGTLSGCVSKQSGTANGTYQITISAAATSVNGVTTSVIANHQVMVVMIVQQTQ